MSHIYYCKYLNNEEIYCEYENLYNGNINQQMEIIKRFVANIK